MSHIFNKALNILKNSNTCCLCHKLYFSTIRIFANIEQNVQHNIAQNFSSLYYETDLKEIIFTKTQTKSIVRHKSNHEKKNRIKDATLSPNSSLSEIRSL